MFYQWFTWKIGNSQWRNTLSPRRVSPSTLTKLDIIALRVINPAISLTRLQDEEGSILILTTVYQKFLFHLLFQILIPELPEL